MSPNKGTIGVFLFNLQNENILQSKVKTISPDIPTENILAVHEAAKSWK